MHLSPAPLFFRAPVSWGVIGIASLSLHLLHSCLHGLGSIVFFKSNQYAVLASAVFVSLINYFFLFCHNFSILQNIYKCTFAFNHRDLYNKEVESALSLLPDFFFLFLISILHLLQYKQYPPLDATPAVIPGLRRNWWLFMRHCVKPICASLLLLLVLLPLLSASVSSLTYHLPHCAPPGWQDKSGRCRTEGHDCLSAIKVAFKKKIDRFHINKS